MAYTVYTVYTVYTAHASCRQPGAQTPRWPTPLERLNAEVKRRTNVVRVLPDEGAILRLVGAMMVKQNDESSFKSMTRRFTSTPARGPTSAVQSFSAELISADRNYHKLRILAS
jgi:hypothetical protein